MKNVIVSFWNERKQEVETSYIYHNMTREAALIAFINQYFKKDYNTFNYPKHIEGIYNSHCIKDRILYNYTDNIIVYAQYA